MLQLQGSRWSGWRTVPCSRMHASTATTVQMPPATAEERVMSPATPGQMNFSQVSMEEDEMNAEQLQCRWAGVWEGACMRE